VAIAHTVSHSDCTTFGCHLRGKQESTNPADKQQRTEYMYITDLNAKGAEVTFPHLSCFGFEEFICKNRQLHFFIFEKNEIKVLNLLGNAKIKVVC
jgi:hypothetical protein